MVLVAAGGLGQEVALLLRALTLPGAEHLLPIACNSRVRGAGTRSPVGWTASVFARSRSSPRCGGASRRSSDGQTREAFSHTLRGVVDLHGQRVSATDKLYLAADVPTLIVWGDRDPIIPMAHGIAAHEAIPGSRLEIFEGVGPLPALRAAGALRRSAGDFLGRRRLAKVGIPT